MNRLVAHSPKAFAKAVRRTSRALQPLARLALAALLALLAVPQGALALTFPADPHDMTPASASLAALQPAGTVVIDYPGGFSSSTPSRLKRNGVGVVVRYVGAARWKSLTRSEANSLRKSGIDIAAVYETSAKWMLGGRKAGVVAAKKARAAVIACGGPRQPFIYFACDTDTGRYSTVNACLQGAASVLGADHVGIYAGYAVCANALKSGYATKAWQTEAWSGGRVLAPSALFQRAHRISGNLGIDYDSNLVRADDIGQWGYTGPGGESWTATSAPTAATLNGVDFADASVGWAVGDNGAVVRSADGGATWAVQPAPSAATLNAVRFADKYSGWAVGESGAIAHTDNGGASWTAQSAPSAATLKAVDFVDASVGTAVGADGTVAHTEDGGMSWTAQPTPTTATLNAINFVDSQTAWSVGASGTVLRTTNGGSNWVRQSSDCTATLNAVDFVGSRVGWAVGSGGTILRTADGGWNWSPQSAPTSCTLTSVRFTDSTTGWAVGDAGTVLRTTNAGATWLAQTPPSTSALLSADFEDGHLGWAVGASGSVLRCVGTGSGPFGTVAGMVTDAVSGAPISGASISVGPSLAAPSATDGSFIAARLAPGTYRVAFSNSRYIAGSVANVVVRAGGRTTVKIRLTPRTATSLTRPSLVTTAPVHTQAATLTATLSPSSAATSEATVISRLHYERKTVVKKVKGKKKKVNVWYWRSRFSRVMSNQGSGRLTTQVVLAAGRWRVKATYAGSGTFLPATSATTSFSVN